MSNGGYPPTDVLIVCRCGAIATSRRVEDYESGVRFEQMVWRWSARALSKDGIFYDDKATDRKRTPLGPTDCGAHTR